MRRTWVLAALLAGCYHPNAERTCEVSCPSGVCPNGMTCGSDGLCRRSPSDDCSAVDDARPPDGDVGTGKICVGEGLFHNYCFVPPTASYSPPPLLQTGSGCHDMVIQDDSTLLCVFVGTQIVIAGPVRVEGPFAVVFVGVDGVVVAAGAVLDVSSTMRKPMAGAGGQGNNCSTPGAGLSISMIGGGGAGGSFAHVGGAGGAGDGGMTVTAPGGAPAAAVVVQHVRGGCGGARGGDGAPATAGNGGRGGGAVYLVSNGTITIGGQINASGEGGLFPAAPIAGGGGGGSGGFVGLDAPMYNLAGAMVYAVGGSAASGSSQMIMGKPGAEATGPASPGLVQGPSGSGIGGAGGAPSVGAAGGNATAGGGGGGGGGAGYIGYTHAPVFPSSSFAPMPVLMP